ncbi:hypothetical protein STEG23_022984, partial [Scotinomys teguina]
YTTPPCFRSQFLLLPSVTCCFTAQETLLRQSVLIKEETRSQDTLDAITAEVIFLVDAPKISVIPFNWAQKAVYVLIAKITCKEALLYCDSLMTTVSSKGLTGISQKTYKEPTVSWKSTEKHEPSGKRKTTERYHRTVKSAIIKKTKGTLVCSTCYLFFEDHIYEKLDAITDEENDMLDLAYGLTVRSRLGYQVCLTKAMDNVTVRVPEHFLTVGHTCFTVEALTYIITLPYLFLARGLLSGGVILIPIDTQAANAVSVGDDGLFPRMFIVQRNLRIALGNEASIL